MTELQSSARAQRWGGRPSWALDTSLARGQMSGIGLYARQLARALAAGPYRERLVFMGGERRALPSEVAWREAETRSRTLWMLGQVPGDLRCVRAGMFHALANFNLPLRPPRGVRLCLTVHDLIPLSHPESVSLPYRLQFGAWLAHSLALADAVICDSAATQEALVARFPSVTATVIPLGVDHLPPRAAALRARRVAERPYLLYLGSLETRKNVGVLLSAYERLADRSLTLVLVGAAGFGGGEILAEVARLQRGGFAVRAVGSVGPAALPGLIAHAELLCAPSAVEGFSLPPLEAMALGTPVVASDIPAHREILGDAARLVPVGEADALAAQIDHLLGEPKLREALVTSGLLRSWSFTWAKTAALTAAVYSALCP